jgi:hypothetical protein
MESISIVFLLCFYSLASVLLSLIPAAIARLRGKKFWWWWFGSWCFLIVAAFFINDSITRYIPLVFLAVLIIAAIIKSPQKLPSVAQDNQQNI